jgi:hypothetical protein
MEHVHRWQLILNKADSWTQMAEIFEHKISKQVQYVAEHPNFLGA